MNDKIEIDITQNKLNVETNDKINVVVHKTDLTNYYTKTESNLKFLSKEEAQNTYATISSVDELSNIINSNRGIIDSIQSEINVMQESLVNVKSSAEEAKNKAQEAYNLALEIDGSPKGVYANLSALQTAFPSGASGVYITEDDGYWNYWNGTEWKKGAVYQSSKDIKQIKEDLDQIEHTLYRYQALDLTNIRKVGYIYDTYFKKENQYESYSSYITIDDVNFKSLKVTANSFADVFSYPLVSFINVDGNRIGKYGTASTIYTDEIIEVPAGTAKIIINDGSGHPKVEVYKIYPVIDAIKGVREETETFDKRIKSVEDNISVNINVSPIIVDTDLGGDCDDTCALRVLSYYESIGEVSTMFVSNGTRNPNVVKGISAMMKYDGAVNVPVNMLDEPTAYYLSDGIYLDVLKQYPYDENSLLPTYGYKSYRKALAESQKKVIIAFIGAYTNLSDLLDSEADEFSSLNGVELVREKVSKIVLMGCAFPNSVTAMDGQGSGTPGAEWNANENKDATNNIIAKCPIDIIWCGWEVGRAIKLGGGMVDKLPSNDIMVKAMEKWGNTYSMNVLTNGRDGYDPITIAIACVSDVGKLGFELVRGTITFNDDGTNTFTENELGKHYYVKMKYDIDYYQKLFNHILSKDWWGTNKNSELYRLR